MTGHQRGQSSNRTKRMTTYLEHVRHGIGAVRPYIYGPVELLDFVQQTFDAMELERHEFGPRSFHVEVKIGDSVARD